MKPEQTKPILIAGPTASGKSALALSLAAHSRSMIINADALQVYEGWQVLTARPSQDDLEQADHRLYGHVGMSQEYSVGKWLAEIQVLKSECDEKHINPIIIGGTGLYFQSLTQGLAPIPKISNKTRSLGNQIADKDPSEFARILKCDDPETAKTIDLNNPMRTQRAWEVLHETQRGMAYWHKLTPDPIIPMHTARCIHINPETEVLNERINKRFDQMVSLGALEECEHALNTFWDPKLPSCQAIGAPEIISHLQGELDLTEAIELAKTKTRQFAKRQRTWFRSKMKNWEMLKSPI